MPLPQLTPFHPSQGRSAEYITNRQQNVADCMAGLTTVHSPMFRCVSLPFLPLTSGPLSRGRSPEYISNRQQNVADCMALLPRLATGIDVNVRFTGIHAFEFTPETAIFDLLDISLVHGWLVDSQHGALFDLLDISLVHGWLVDSQDSATAAAVGSLSYSSIEGRLAALQASHPRPLKS
ncbi:unnamed protein product [Closterium sp. NIES-53]